jgi:enamine deaminase RidA (YjgF/YER057c/UK114 family)
MPQERKAIVPAEWADFYEETRIPAAVRVGDTLRVTGHTGETADGVFSRDVEEQIRQTLCNISVTPTEAGAGRSDIAVFNSCHVGLLNQAEALFLVAGEFLEEPYPAWAAVGVTELIIPEALVEIGCVAVGLPDLPQSQPLHLSARCTRPDGAGEWHAPGIRKYRPLGPRSSEWASRTV